MAELTTKQKYEQVKSPQAPRQRRPRAVDLMREISDYTNEARKTADWFLGVDWEKAQPPELRDSVEKIGRMLDEAYLRLRWLRRDIESTEQAAAKRAEKKK